MEMNNNLRLESHVAQKNRRHKLRFQQNSSYSGDHQHSYNVFPSEMLNSIAKNPHLLLPPAHNQHSAHFGHLPNNNNPQLPQDCNNWNVVSTYGYQQYHHQDVQNAPPPVYTSSSSLPLYHDTLQQDQDHHQISKNDNNHHSIPCWMNSFDHREQLQIATTNNSQGLSLSLSSVPHDQQSGLKSDNSDPKASFMGSSVTVPFVQRNSGPLGPFTGYATILKNSKYLKPAQDLLNQNCDVGGQELLVQTSNNDVYSHKILQEEMSRASGGSDEHVSGRNSSGADQSIQPEFHQKKARLLYMQEEVCRRYKQYLQQMQMVISSFETVAGLSAATPYVCLALKAVSRRFHFVKNTISDQLLQMKKMIGDGLCSSTTTSKGFDANATSGSRLKCIDQRLGKSGGGGAAGYFASQQPVWRPQRGLPERAISVLKTWLFDHFLHPYPSDADKHMLATQTGLTRNQVSNWFINARVRIWKPMVEEIHTLETKGLADQTNPTNPQPTNTQDPNRMDMSSLSSVHQPPECSRNNNVPGTLTVDEPNNIQLRDHDKQDPEYQLPLTSMDRFMSIMPSYPRATFDASGLGPVSLTLGLRQNADHVQQLQQHFGGHLIHDFVG